MSAQLPGGHEWAGHQTNDQDEGEEAVIGQPDAGTERDEIDHRSGDAYRHEPGSTRSVRTLGLVTDPDMPERVARHLAEELPGILGDEYAWTVEVDVDPVTADRRNASEILPATRDRMDHHDWDYAICLTDLPVRANRKPVIADTDIENRVGVI